MGERGCIAGTGWLVRWRDAELPGRLLLLLLGVVKDEDDDFDRPLGCPWGDTVLSMTLRGVRCLAGVAAVGVAGAEGSLRFDFAVWGECRSE